MTPIPKSPFPYSAMKEIPGFHKKSEFGGEWARDKGNCLPSPVHMSEMDTTDETIPHLENFAHLNLLTVGFLPKWE